ncbi:MAG: hypothetical protein IKV57_07780 [Clostridia bacterium]|nr:hypothetical protein [Clostridia bacterium]
MNVQLPPLQEEKILRFPYFPTPWQCVIFRNWGLVPADRIAAVLQTTESVVRAEAAALGLDPETIPHPDWLTKGYITIIHYNWHILSYDKICTLLQWTPQRLAYTLREDDFQEIKLGSFKPAVPDTIYRPLTEEEAAETAKIRQIIKETLRKLPEEYTAPFDFLPHFAKHGGKPMTIADPRFEERYLYSYCALYGDTFADRNLLDASFPDELLEAYAANGITGIWTHVVLYTIVPYPFDPALSEGWEARQDGMRYLTEKLAKYGLRLFLYFNEPRAMPESFFAKHPELRGRKGDPYSTLCTSLPEVQNYLRDSVRMLAEKLPLLGGFFTITASENLTSCHSHAPLTGNCGCPRCDALGIKRTDTFALINRLIWEGVSAVSDSIRVIAWSWGWHQSETPEVIEKLPREVAVMNVSEQAVRKNIGGTVTSVIDYSLSVEGPGEYSLATWTKAHREGHKGYAKMQLNNTWELAAVPCIPAFEKVYRHLRRLSEAGEAAPDGLMLSWTLGGYPSPTISLLSRFFDKAKPLPELSEIYEEMFPKADVSAIAEAVHHFSEAFDAFPFDIGCAYHGPQFHAPANWLFADPTGFRATMTGFPYDDIIAWRNIFPEETYISQLKILSDGWHKGLEILRPVCEGADSVTLRELWDCAEVCDAHFRSMYLQCQFVCLRDGKPAEDGMTFAGILAEEESISLRVAAVQAHNPMIGYESTNHYVYWKNNLLEKVINCRYLTERMGKS